MIYSTDNCFIKPEKSLKNNASVSLDTTTVFTDVNSISALSTYMDIKIKSILLSMQPQKNYSVL